MKDNTLPNVWNAKLNSGVWVIENEKGKIVATVNNSGDDKANAKIIAASPYMLEALKAMAELIGDEDLPDNGELSGAAICDMVRSAISLVTKAN